jgi:hypothetical protein
VHTHLSLKYVYILILKYSESYYVKNLAEPILFNILLKCHYRRRRAGSLVLNLCPLAPTAVSLAPKPIDLAMAQGKRKSSDAHTSSRATESFSRAVTHR